MIRLKDCELVAARIVHEQRSKNISMLIKNYIIEGQEHTKPFDTRRIKTVL